MTKVRERIGALINRWMLHQDIDPLTRGCRERKIYGDWLRNGRPIPPPHIVKQMAVKEYAERFGLRIFVETGTLYGDMLSAVESFFDEIYSIELGQELFERARKRFARKGHITILQGDSADVLPALLARIKRPCLFWLDGHWSAGITARGAKNTPIREEICHILPHSVRGHVILIDDARCFTGLDDYPTLEQLREKMTLGGLYEAFEVRDDIIRIH